MHPPADSNLPVPLTALVGRHQEQEAVRALLQQTRLLSLIGTGGCGKTRLALAVGWEELAGGRHPDGVWWVELGSLASPGLVSGVVAAALDAPQPPGGDPAGLLVRHLRGRRLLVVMDNCEHVVDECAELAETLLRACPGVKILATSREVVGAAGEQVYRLEGLDGSADGSDAVRLFVERARAARPDFAAGPRELPVIGRICQRLDGLPLAIELAAAGAGVLGVAEIAERLDDVRLLRHPSRTAPARHRTLDDALDWSHGLLSPVEQDLFARLSVFEGTFSLLAAEAVVPGGALEAKDVAGLLGGLVNRSLVKVADPGPEHRYRLLRTVRHYAAAKLAAGDTSGPEGSGGGHGVGAAVRAAHARFYLTLAQQAHVGLEGGDQVQWLQRLELEHDNLRAVLRRHLPSAPGVGGRLAALLWPFWYRRGYYHEARAWLEEAASLSTEMTPGVTADVLTGAGTLAFLQCDYKLATERLEGAMALYQEDGNRTGTATVLQRLGSVAREEGRYGDARRLHQASLALWEELGDLAGVAASEDYLGFVAWLEGDGATATGHCQRAVAYFEGAGLRQETAAALVNLAMACHHGGDDAQATTLLRQALAVSSDIGYQEGLAWASHELGSVLPAGHPEVPPLLCQSLNTHVQLGDRWRTASVLETIAARLLVSSDPPAAARLLAASAAQRRRVGAPVPPAEAPLVDGAAATLEKILSPPDLEAARAAGAALSFTEAVELGTQACQAPALGPQGTPAAAGGAPAPVTDAHRAYELTDREADVLRLVSQGLTNREIAAQLFISTGTAGVHVSNILRKLGVSSRVKAAGLARRMGLGD